MTMEQIITETELATFEDASETEDCMSSCPSEQGDDEDMDEVETTASNDKYHDLYLPFDTSLSDEQPIVFSGGMSYDQCNEYYRVLELEEARRSTSMRRRHRFFLGRSGSRSSKAAKTAFEFDLSASDASSTQNEDTQLVDSIAVSAPCSKAIRRGSDASTASTASTSSSSSLSSSASSSSTSSSRITFDDTVTVFKVPSIEDFPDDVWQATWKSRQEVRAHKKLSKKEYAWDGYDWKNATEEDDMILDPTTGTLEHPVHYDSVFANSRSTGPTFALRLGLSR